ncbi:MAG: hypothetical protein GY861_14515 [bacterium]|nr:hypothetical protein [bacterium]
MKITSIKRVISDGNYGNIGLEADIEDGDDITKPGIELTKRCHDTLNAIVEKRNETSIRTHEENKMLDKVEALKKAIQKHEISDLPF